MSQGHINATLKHNALGLRMGLLKIHLCKNSFRPFVTLLGKHGLNYTVREERLETPTAVRFIDILHSAEIWGDLPSVVTEFTSQYNRKVIITSRDGQKINAAGFTHKELEQLLAHATHIKVIEESIEKT